MTFEDVDDDVDRTDGGDGEGAAATMLVLVGATQATNFGERWKSGVDDDELLSVYNSARNRITQIITQQQKSIRFPLS